VNSVKVSKSTPVTAAIAGASGRMGRQLLIELDAGTDLSVCAAWVGPDSTLRGNAVPGTTLSYGSLGQVAESPQVVIDFSHAQAFDAVLAWCVGHTVPLVSGTTGLSSQQHERVQAAADVIPVLWSANFSLGVAVLSRLVAEAGRALPDWDAEIVESHHAGKRDAPSGTALALGKVLAAARDQTFDDHAVLSRNDLDRPRQRGEIGFASVRAGDIIGEHNVILAIAGERLELGHRATDRSIFARGAVHAARWLVDRPPGLYRLDDTLS
jgi:4-hydroxy-tetrahydrodipicolinate reductase